MDKKQIVSNFLKAVESGQLTSVKYLDDNFTMSLPGSIRLGDVQLITFSQMVRASIPDLSFKISEISENGDKVTASISLSGTYQNDFMMPGYLSLEATGQPINIPASSFDFLFLLNISIT
ncbi:hypothetical protein EON78_04455, partial [bacterium]